MECFWSFLTSPDGLDGILGNMMVTAFSYCWKIVSPTVSVEGRMRHSNMDYLHSLLNHPDSTATIFVKSILMECSGWSLLICRDTSDVTVLSCLCSTNLDYSDLSLSLLFPLSLPLSLSLSRLYNLPHILHICCTLVLLHDYLLLVILSLGLTSLVGLKYIGISYTPKAKDITSLFPSLNTLLYTSEKSFMYGTTVALLCFGVLGSVGI